MTCSVYRRVVFLYKVTSPTIVLAFTTQRLSSAKEKLLFIVHCCHVNVPLDYTEEEIHCLTFCRARLGCWRDTFLSQLTSSTLPVLADSPELTSSAWGGTLCMCVCVCVSICFFQQGRTNQEYWLAGRESAVIFMYPSESMNTSLTEQRKIIWHLTMQDTKGEMCGHMQAQTRGQSGYFSLGWQKMGYVGEGS